MKDLQDELSDFLKKKDEIDEIKQKISQDEANSTHVPGGTISIAFADQYYKTKQTIVFDNLKLNALIQDMAQLEIKLKTYLGDLNGKAIACTIRAGEFGPNRYYLIPSVDETGKLTVTKKGY